MKPLQTGLSLSITVAVFYSLCTLAGVMCPEQFMGLMNALFHGLDFRRLYTSEPYGWPSFFYAFVVLAVWGFAIGAFFAWLHNALSKTQFQHVARHEQS